MRFGIYVEQQCPPGKSHRQPTDGILEQIVHADRYGFDTYDPALRPELDATGFQFYTKQRSRRWREQQPAGS